MKAAAKIYFKPHKAHVGIEMFTGIQGEDKENHKIRNNLRVG